MKQISPFAILLITITSGIVFSCVKHKGDIEEHIPASSINFASPTKGAVYRNGDSVAIQATGISTETIHGYDITIKKVNDTTVYFFKHVHDHNDTLNIDQKWKNNLGGYTNLEAGITLYLDHEGHTSTKKVGFSVQ